MQIFTCMWEPPWEDEDPKKWLDLCLCIRLNKGKVTKIYGKNERKMSYFKVCFADFTWP